MFLLLLFPCAYTSISAALSLCVETVQTFTTLLNLAQTPTSTLENALLLSSVITFWAAAANLPNRLRPTLTSLLIVFSVFLVLTIYYTRTDNLIQFFIIYELFLLPSAVLVWILSPNKRSIRSCLYFLLWTQAGSMLVLGGVVLLINHSTSVKFSTLAPVSGVAPLLIWVGFSVKIPLAPFYFWLTKTHVEAITSFSIFLSGFLVKLAVIGLWKFTPILTPNLQVGFLAAATLTVVLASVAFSYQTDYKKLVAYATVQEMGLLSVIYALTVRLGTEPTANLLVIHTLLSALFFSIADMLYKRYQTRVINLIKGLLVLAPGLYTLILTALIIFKGLPFTAKFSIEYHIFNTALNYAPPLAFILVLAMTVLGNLFISIIHFKMSFNHSDRIILDLTRREFLLITCLLTPLVFCLL